MSYPSQAVIDGSRNTFDLHALLAEDDAAKFLGYSQKSLQRWRIQGGGPKFVKVSQRSIRYRKLDLITWSEERVRTSTSDDGK
jgi:hypothetical protein